MITAYRAALPGVAAICSLIAFVIALCCLLAGTNPSTLHHMELYTLNTSKIAPTLIRTMGLTPLNHSLDMDSLIPRDALDSALSKAKDGVDDIGDNIAEDASDLVKDPKAAIENLKKNITQSVDQAKQQVSTAVSKAEDAVKNATNDIVTAFVNETIEISDIQDFYVAHLLTYCEGNYTEKGKKNVTFCSNHKPDNNKTSNSSTANNGTLPLPSMDSAFTFLNNLHLPDPIEYAFKAMTLIGKIISAFYIVALISLFCSLVASACLIPAYFAPPNLNPLSGGGGSSKRTILRWLTLLSSACAFFTLLLASTMVHFLVKKLVGLFEAHPHLGVKAVQGGRFMGCTWAAVIITGIAMMVAVADLVIGLMVNGVKTKVRGGVESGGNKWFGRDKQREKEQFEMVD